MAGSINRVKASTSRATPQSCGCTDLRPVHRGFRRHPPKLALGIATSRQDADGLGGGWCRRRFHVDPEISSILFFGVLKTQDEGATPLRVLSDVSATDPDWSRERCIWGVWNPAARLLRALRRYQRWQARRGPVGVFVRKLSALEHRFWEVVCGSSISLEASIGGGLLMPHPQGIVMGPVTLGPNCLVFQQVTLGTSESNSGWPRIGGHVDIGAGAKILGGITVGDHAKIGANAVVLEDVPAEATAVGVPARIIPAAPLRAPVRQAP